MSNDNVYRNYLLSYPSVSQQVINAIPEGSPDRQDLNGFQKAGSMPNLVAHPANKRTAGHLVS